MFEIFVRHPYLSSGVVVTVFVSVLLQILIGNVLGRMVNEAENMSSTEDKQLKQCKLKFMNCYKMNEGMENVTVFVEHFLEKVSIGKLKITFVHRMSNQLMLFSVLLSGLGAARGIVLNETIGQVLPFYLFAFFRLNFFSSMPAKLVAT